MYIYIYISNVYTYIYIIIIIIIITIIIQCALGQWGDARAARPPRAAAEGGTGRPLIHMFFFLFHSFCFKLYRVFFLLNGSILGVTFGTGRGETNVTQKIVQFGVSVLAVVTNKVETTMATCQNWDKGL